MLLGSRENGPKSSAGTGAPSMAETTGSLTGAGRPKDPENTGPSTLDKRSERGGQLERHWEQGQHSNSSVPASRLGESVTQEER